MNGPSTSASLLRPDVLNELMETARLCPSGDLVEVGVYQGGSALALAEVARERGLRLILFDTFTGIPHADPDLDVHRVGDFADTSLERVQAAIPEAICVQGVFPDSMIGGVGPIALAHVDCDQYASVMACCKVLGPLMAPGGVMVFDDYDVLPGARRAVDEFFGADVVISPQGKARVLF